MSPIIAMRNLWHRRLTHRDYLALLLLLVTVSACASTWVQYRHAQEALNLAIQGRNRLRADRLKTETEFCRALNQTRIITNRDRRTFVRAIKTAKHDLHVVHDPLLAGLLRKGIVEDRRELRVRPHLSTLPCRRLIYNPRGVKIPGL